MPLVRICGRHSKENKLSKKNPTQAQRRKASSVERKPENQSPIISNEVLENLSEESKVAAILSASFSGPLPPPSLFGKYDEILPGSANRILEHIEREQSHRHGQEDRALEFQNKGVSRGQYLGFLLGIAAIIGSVVCAYSGQTLVAIVVIGSSSLAAIIAAWIRKASKQD